MSDHRRRFALALAAGMLSAAAPVPLYAAEPLLSITVYANGLALIDDARTVPANGTDTLHIDGTSPQMIADSLVVDLEGGLAVQEIDLDSGVLTPQSLLRHALGKQVRVVRIDPQTGRDISEDAEVLSVEGGIVLRIGDRIETAPPGRLVFDAVPPGLGAVPALTLRLDKPATAAVPARISYLTDGMGWEAAYTVVLAPDHATLDLDAWASVYNGTGVDFGPAMLRVVAGEVSREPMPRGKILMRAEAMMASDGGPVGAPRGALSAFHIYRLADRVSLANDQSKRLRLLSAPGVVARRSFEVRTAPPVFGVHSGRAEPIQAQQWVTLFNDVASRLGQPLPAGVVRAYVRGAEGQLSFIGEDRIADTPIGGEVRLDLGRAFDVTVTRRQTDFKVIGERATEAAFALSLHNASTAPATVRIVEDIPGDFEILAESAPSARDGLAAVWGITVPAEGKTELNYRVRVRR